MQCEFGKSTLYGARWFAARQDSPLHSSLVAAFFHAKGLLHSQVQAPPPNEVQLALGGQALASTLHASISVSVRQGGNAAGHQLPATCPDTASRLCSELVLGGAETHVLPPCASCSGRVKL